ncbi:MAG: DegV family protein [Christensenellales bacterium]
MKDFILSVESVCNIDEKTLKDNDIKVAPMKFMVNDVEFCSDDKDFDVEKISDFMKEGATTKTTQINQFEAKEYLENLLKEGKDVLHLSFSSTQSGTCANFVSVADELNKTHNNKVYVVDTLCLAGGIGVLIEWLLDKMKTENLSIVQARDFVEANKLKICHYFTVDNLKYLVRGGRISKSSAFIGSLLQIKPVCNLTKEGIMASFKKVVGRKKSVFELFEFFKQKFNWACKQVIIAHAGCKTDAQILCDLIKNEFDVNVSIVPLSLVVVSHGGPGSLSVFFTGDER